MQSAKRKLSEELTLRERMAAEVLDQRSASESAAVATAAARADLAAVHGELETLQLTSSSQVDELRAIASAEKQRLQQEYCQAQQAAEARRPRSVSHSLLQCF